VEHQGGRELMTAQHIRDQALKDQEKLEQKLHALVVERFKRALRKYRKDLGYALRHPGRPVPQEFLVKLQGALELEIVMSKIVPWLEQYGYKAESIRNTASSVLSGRRNEWMLRVNVGPLEQQEENMEEVIANAPPATQDPMQVSPFVAAAQKEFSAEIQQQKEQNEIQPADDEDPYFEVLDDLPGARPLSKRLQRMALDD
jgi:hypothetical protein